MFSRILVCPVETSPLSMSRRFAVSSPSTTRPFKSRIVTLPAGRLVTVNAISIPPSKWMFRPVLFVPRRAASLHHSRGVAKIGNSKERIQHESKQGVVGKRRLYSYRGYDERKRRNARQGT